MCRPIHTLERIYLEHHALVVGPEVLPADRVAHEDEDVGFLVAVGQHGNTIRHCGSHQKLEPDCPDILKATLTLSASKMIGRKIPPYQAAEQSAKRPLRSMQIGQISRDKHCPKGHGRFGSIGGADL